MSVHKKATKTDSCRTRLPTINQYYYNIYIYVYIKILTNRHDKDSLTNNLMG